MLARSDECWPRLAERLSSLSPPPLIVSHGAGMSSTRARFIHSGVAGSIRWPPTHSSKRAATGGKRGRGVAVARHV